MTFIDRIKASGKDFNTFKTAIQDKCYEGVYVNVDMKNGLPYIEISTHHRFRIYDFHVEMANVNDENYAGKYENICSRILSSIFEDYADKKAQYDQLRDQVKSIDKETYKKFWHIAGSICNRGWHFSNKYLELSIKELLRRLSRRIFPWAVAQDSCKKAFGIVCFLMKDRPNCI